MKDLRKLVATLVIVSFSVAALMGIIALLGGGDFGETEGRILATTVVVGIESIAILCYLAVAGHRLAVVGVIGGLVSIAATALALWQVWGDFEADIWQEFATTVTIAASLAQASLLIALAGRHRIGAGLLATLAAISVVAVMIIIPVLNESDPGGGYWRIFGVVAILDVLGTVVLTATGAFGRRDSREAEPKLLSAALESRLVDAAQQRGVSPSQLLSEMLDSFTRQ